MFPNLEEIEVGKVHRSDDKEKKAAKREVNVDMNPMVDLAFLLLTFFMLATTFNKPQAMELVVPAKPKESDQEKETPVKESKTYSLVLLEDKAYWYRGITDPSTEEISLEQSRIETVLRAAQESTEGMIVLIKPLETADYEDLVMIFDALNVVEAKRYALSEPSEFDQKLQDGKE